MGSSSITVGNNWRSEEGRGPARPSPIDSWEGSPLLGERGEGREGKGTLHGDPSASEGLDVAEIGFPS